MVSIGDLAAGLGSARLAFMAAPRNFAVVFDRGVSSTDLADRASAIQREASDTRNEIQKLMASLRWRKAPWRVDHQP